MNTIFPAILALMALVVLVVMVLFFSILRLWLRAVTSGVPIQVFRIVGMRLRGNPAQLLIDAHILLVKGGSRVSIDETEYVFTQNRNRVRIPEDLVQLVKTHQKPN